MTDIQPTIVAIDGPAGAGKSTVASMLAASLDIPYIDTGAMYRAVAFAALREGLRLPLDEQAVSRIEDLLREHRVSVRTEDRVSRVFVDGEDVSEKVRTQECAAMASAVSALKAVRLALVALQRQIGHAEGGVMEGRDIGTVVFPDADLKVFLTASADERARRRFNDLLQRDIDTTVDEVRQQQHERDRQDSSRAESPLMVATGAVVVDTSGMSPEEVVQRLLSELGKSTEKTLDSGGENTVRSRNHRG